MTTDGEDPVRRALAGYGDVQCEYGLPNSDPDEGFERCAMIAGHPGDHVTYWGSTGAEWFTAAEMTVIERYLKAVNL
jgi:hypothetical protein